MDTVSITWRLGVLLGYHDYLETTSAWILWVLEYCKYVDIVRTLRKWLPGYCVYLETVSTWRPWVRGCCECVDTVNTTWRLRVLGDCEYVDTVSAPLRPTIELMSHLVVLSLDLTLLLEGMLHPLHVCAHAGSFLSSNQLSIQLLSKLYVCGLKRVQP